MTLIVEVEDFLNEARSRTAATAHTDAAVVIYVARPIAGESSPTVCASGAACLTPDEDEFVTWQDAAWQ